VGVVCQFHIHRAQITFDALDTDTGEMTNGKIPSSREAVVGRSGAFEAQDMHVAVEACNGRYFVVRALERAGAVPELAVHAQALRWGRKRRATTHRADARLLRPLPSQGRLSQAWIPPEHICFLRIPTRLRKMLSDEATAWRERIEATRFTWACRCRGLEGERARPWLARLELAAAARERSEVCVRMIKAVGGQLMPADTERRCFLRRQAGCRALERHFGVGDVLALTILTAGYVGRLRRSRPAGAGCRTCRRGGALRPPRPARQAHQARLAAAALGAA
jgi:transposase